MQRVPGQWFLDGKQPSLSNQPVLKKIKINRHGCWQKKRGNKLDSNRNIIVLNEKI